jgi:hypothetical protein
LQYVDTPPIKKYPTKQMAKKSKYDQAMKQAAKEAKEKTEKELGTKKPEKK